MGTITKSIKKMKTQKGKKKSTWSHQAGKWQSLGPNTSLSISNPIFLLITETATHWKHNLNHICNFKFSKDHIENKRKPRKLILRIYFT